MACCLTILDSECPDDESVDGRIPEAEEEAEEVEVEVEVVIDVVEIPAKIRVIAAPSICSLGVLL